MFRYYLEDWLPNRDYFTVAKHTDGRPLVEVAFEIAVGGFTFEGEFDAIVVDAEGLYWVMEYKTAKQFNTSKLEADQQVTSYTWAAQQIFGKKFEGVVYQQHLKQAPTPPEPLKSGKLSKNKNQKTTYPLYFAAIKQLGLDIRDYQEFLDHLLDQQTDHADAFVRRDFVHRSQSELESFEANLELLLPEYVNPALPIYPNHTRDCNWDCDYQTVCQAMDDKSDWKGLLNDLFVQKTVD